MKIIYVANFDAGQNDDEGAIQHALRELGHEVLPLREGIGYRATAYKDQKPDLILFHKWHDLNTLDQFKGVCPRVFWWFDLVEWPKDPTLENRSEARRQWMSATLTHIELGFMSDGDWVRKDTTGKLKFLTQGADGRIVGKGSATCTTCERPGWDFDILFTGISRGGGAERESFVESMQTRYGTRFRHVTRGVHREELKEMIAAAKIVVCPDSPVTDHYWSNRVWNAMGFGGFVLHPFCERLSKMYKHGTEIHYYENRLHLHTLIDCHLRLSTVRRVVAEQGLNRTIKEHLYKHRCEELISHVQKL